MGTENRCFGNEWEKITMRYILILTVVAGFLVAGCETGPKHEVKMAPPSVLEPRGTDPPPEKPRLTEIRPVESPEPDQPKSEKTPTLTEVTEGQSYTVQKGETYWKIATEMLGNGQRWKEIETLNPGVDRNNLKVGQVILIPVK